MSPADLRRANVNLAAFGLVMTLLLLLSLILGGCAPPAPRVVYREVVKPVPVTCVPERLGPAPEGLETREGLRAEPDPAKRYVRLAADWAKRAARMEETEPVIQACR